MTLGTVNPGQLARADGSLVLTGRPVEGGSWLPSPGVPFLAEVLEQEGSRVLLAVAGRLLRAQTALPLEPGTAVRLTVREATPERITLGLFISGSGTACAAAFATGSGTDPASATAANAASLLPHQEAPLPPDQALARAVAFLLARGGPLSREAVESLVPFFAGTADLAETLATLERLLSAAPRQDQTPWPAGLAERLRAALAAVQVPVDAGQPAELNERLAAAVRSLGLDYEVRLARALLTETLPSSQQLPEHSSSQAAPDSPGNHPTPPAHVVAEPRAADQTAIAAPQDDLKGLLLLLQRVLKTQQDQPQEPLARAVEEALRNLTGQRLLAAPERGSEPTGAEPGQGRLALYLQLPVVVGESRHTAELRIYREAGRRRGARGYQPAALRLSCRLTTTHLGPVRVDLSVRAKGTGEAHLFLGSDQVIELFRTREDEFREALTQAGLALGRVTYTLLPSPPPIPSAYGIPGTADSGTAGSGVAGSGAAGSDVAGSGGADGQTLRPGAVDLRL